MAKSLDDVEKFIELRARGLSFEKIAQELGVSKPTLLKWERENDSRVAEARALELQGVLEKYQLMRSQRAEAFSSLLSSALLELRRRSETLQELSTEKLLSVVLSLEGRLTGDIKLHLCSSLDELVYKDRGSDIRVD